MRPRRDDETLVDLIDVLLRDGVVVRADVIVSVAEIPLVGIKLNAVLAGMETMNEYGHFAEWDARRRRRAIARQHADDADEEHPSVESVDRLTVSRRDGDGNRDTDDDEETNREAK